MNCRPSRGVLTLLFFIHLWTAQSVLGADDSFIRALETLIASGMKGTAEGFRDAENAYQRARRLAADDGRVDYAWALVLTRHRKFDEADEASRKAIGAKQTCLAAHTARLRDRVRNRKFDEAIDMLTELAELAGDPSQAHLTAKERSGAARWLGRVFAFLTGSLGDPEIAAAAQRRERAIRTQLAALETAFDEGMQSQSLEHRKLQDEMTELMASAEEKRTEALRAGNEKLAKVENDYRSASAEASSTQRNLKESAADLEAKLTGMQKQYAKLVETEQTLTLSIAGLEQSVIALNIDLDRIRRAAIDNPRLNTANAEFVIGQRISQAGIELELTRNSLTLVQGQKDSILRTATGLFQQRMASRSAQQQLSGASAQLSANLQRWQKTILEQSKKISQTPVEKTGRVTAMRMKIQSWGTYDRNDQAVELAALIDSV